MAADRRPWASSTLVSRLWGISYPTDQLFDEAYYPPEAHELLTWGFEYNRGYSFIVHPPLGKWLIAVGEQLFGYNSFGWRFPSAVAGAVAVVVLVRLARRLTGSTLLGLLAGLLLALDGFSFTSSRIGLLDVFLQVFVVAAVACLVVDRDKVRARVRAMDGGRRPGSARAAGGSRPGSCSGAPARSSGAASGSSPSSPSSRCSGTARPGGRPGSPRPTRTTLRRGLPGAVWALGAVPVLTYLASFTGWFLGETSQGKAWAQQHPDTAFASSPTRCARCGTSTPSG